MPRTGSQRSACGCSREYACRRGNGAGAQSGCMSESQQTGRPRVRTTARPGAPTCMQRLRARWRSARTLLCVGLDTELERLPNSVRGAQTSLLLLDEERQGNQVEAALLSFNKAIVDATADLVCAYKPNTAFYEARGRRAACAGAHRRLHPGALSRCAGAAGRQARRHRQHQPGLRARRSSMSAAPTRSRCSPISAAMRWQPFLERADRGGFILCRTSNPGARRVPGSVGERARGRTKSRSISRRAPGGRRLERERQLRAGRRRDLSRGAATVRGVVGDLPMLVPGIGAQGGDLRGDGAAPGWIARARGCSSASSRSILYASSGRDFASAAAAAGGLAATLGARSRRGRAMAPVPRGRGHSSCPVRQSAKRDERLTETQRAFADALLGRGAVKFGAFRLKLHERSRMRRSRPST